LMTSLPVKGPNRANIAQLPVAHACTLPRKPLQDDVTFDDVTSGSHVVDISSISAQTKPHFRWSARWSYRK
jgi:hypothetical protein